MFGDDAFSQGIIEILKYYEGDERAIQAIFKESIPPSDLFVLHMTPEMNGHQGGAGFRHDTLTRTDAGYHQKRDISACLSWIFGPGQIMMNPRPKDNHKENLDHFIRSESWPSSSK